MQRGRARTKAERLREAAQAGDLTTITALIQQGGLDVNETDNYGINAVMVACQGGHQQIVEELLEAGANINAKDKYGQTALIFAVSKGHFKLANLLIERKASVNAQSTFGQTALMKAVYGHSLHSVSIIQLLLRNKAKINLQAEDGRTAVMIAAEHNNLKAIEIMNEHQADNLNLQDNEGRTALMFAAAAGSYTMIEGLISMGADDTIKNKQGQSVYEISPSSSLPGTAATKIQESIRKGKILLQQKLDRQARLAMGSGQSGDGNDNERDHIHKQLSSPQMLIIDRD